MSCFALVPPANSVAFPLLQLGLRRGLKTSRVFFSYLSSHAGTGRRRRYRRWCGCWGGRSARLASTVCRWWRRSRWSVRASSALQLESLRDPRPGGATWWRSTARTVKYTARSGPGTPHRQGSNAGICFPVPGGRDDVQWRALWRKHIINEPTRCPASEGMCTLEGSEMGDAHRQLTRAVPWSA